MVGELQGNRPFVLSVYVRASVIILFLIATDLARCTSVNADATANREYDTQANATPDPPPFTLRREVSDGHTGENYGDTAEDVK